MVGIIVIFILIQIWIISAASTTDSPPMILRNNTHPFFHGKLTLRRPRPQQMPTIDKWKAKSRYDTNMTNQEKIALEEAQRLYQQHKRTPIYNFKNTMLCVTFIGNVSLQQGKRWLLKDNVVHTTHICNWAIIAYDLNIGVTNLNELCNALPNIVHCNHASLLLSNSTITKPNSIPKSVLYLDVLSLLRDSSKGMQYKHVFLLDEDIYLGRCNLQQFVQYWQLLPKIAPLITQPLVEGTIRQYIPWLNVANWREYKKSIEMHTTTTTLQLQEVAFIEQQVPMFDSLFFEWFLASILSRVRNVVMTNGADWGHDRCWCKAASDYATHVLQQPNRLGCGLVLPPSDSSEIQVYHLNFRSMKMKREQRAVFREKAADSVMHYIELFPTWVVIDILNTKNPFTNEGKAVLRSVNITL